MKLINENDMEIIRQCIISYKETFFETPTIREIAASTGIPKSTVGRYVKMMRDAGEQFAVMDPELPNLGPSVKIPIAGEVSCGMRRLATQDISGYVSLPMAYLGQGDYYILIADGESMKKIGIHTGDLVLIRQQSFAEPGQVVVALVDGEDATLKRFYPDYARGYVNLVAENDDIDDQTIMLRTGSEVQIQGVAVSVLMRLIR